MFHQFVVWLADTVGQWGYSGIVVLMTLESSFFPFPSEIVIPPAAYLAATGKMNIGLVILYGTLGSLLGAAFNYWLALKFGRPFFERYGRYLLVSQQSLATADRFFARHGHISTFIGRLLPGIRQYISFPAGLGPDEYPCLFSGHRIRSRYLGGGAGGPGILVWAQRAAGTAEPALAHRRPGARLRPYRGPLPVEIEKPATRVRCQEP